jgi:hypothetical protein
VTKSQDANTVRSKNESNDLELTVLAVGTHGWAIEQATRALEVGGHRVLRCHEPGEPAFPCNALIEGRTCPLEVGFDVVVTIRAQPFPAPTLPEFGVICALHTGRPLVVAGMSAHNPFENWAERSVTSDGDIATACEEAVRAHETRFASATIDLRETS